jgi:hypothetical protein
MSRTEHYICSIIGGPHISIKKVLTKYLYYTFLENLCLTDPNPYSAQEAQTQPDESEFLSPIYSISLSTVHFASTPAAHNPCNISLYATQ